MAVRILCGRIGSVSELEFMSVEEWAVEQARPTVDQASGETASSPVKSIPLTGEEPEPGLTWCGFCKGYYIEEYHIERMAT